mmetsp:Transcript_95202/g.254538  ORF Transcript_95202/g.254538 Transcript_95202/m.254538 type:complete len:210 (-) Transcript_95202:2-631(-)
MAIPNRRLHPSQDVPRHAATWHLHIHWRRHHLSSTTRPCPAHKLTAEHKLLVQQRIFLQQSTGDSTLDRAVLRDWRRILGADTCDILKLAQQILAHVATVKYHVYQQDAPCKFRLGVHLTGERSMQRHPVTNGDGVVGLKLQLVGSLPSGRQIPLQFHCCGLLHRVLADTNVHIDLAGAGPALRLSTHIQNTTERTTKAHRHGRIHLDT